MKELSIEEKAKAYDKALERVKDFIEKQNPPAFDKDLIGTIYPELAESNDEKIRKVLIKFFSMGAKYNQHTDGIADKDIIAWLEKQGQVKESAISQQENRTCEENGNSLTSEDAIEREVKEDAGGYPYIDATELYDYENDKPLAKAGDRVKVVFIKDK